MMAPEERAARLAKARHVDARIKAIATRRKEATAELAFLLFEFDQERLYEPLGYDNVAAYAEREGYVESEREAYDLVKIVRDLQGAPEWLEAFRRGELFPTKVRTIAPFLRKHPERSRELLDATRKHPNRVLEALIREGGGATPVTRTFTFDSEEDAAWVQQRIEEVRRDARAAGANLTAGQALAQICRASKEGSTPDADVALRPSRVVIHMTADGKRAWLETRDGQVPVSQATVDEALCNAELSDVTGDPARLSRTVPPRIARHVHDRDHGRCRAPGCKNRGFLHIHHEPGWKATGHDPDCMLLLCTTHHRMRHLGYLTIQGRHSIGFRFFLSDGTELTAPTTPTPSPTCGTNVTTVNLQLAKAALKRLGVSAAESDQLLAAARAELEARGEACSVERLVQVVLGKLGPPRG
jgi:hypothetical protein